MAKKKKSKLKDARGYSQSQGGPSKGNAASSSNNIKPSKKAPSVSTKTHHDMKELLNQFGNVNVAHQGTNNMIESTALTSSSSKPTSTSGTNNRMMIPPSDRFQTKLTNIVNTLDTLQFTPTQIELVITSLQYQVTLESALDWLCLHLSTLDLPALFTDGELRQDMGQVTTVDSLVVVLKQEKKSAGAENGNGDDSAENNDNVLVVPMDMDMDNSKAKEVGYISSKEEVEKKEQQDEAEIQQEKDRKDWLLQQYQYEEEEGEKDEENKAVESHDIDEQVQALLSPEEQQLAKEEAALAELDADANNDANNYMRSKGEIKELKIQVKKMRQRVAGLRRRVEKDRALQLKLGKEKEEEEEKAAMNKSSLEEENGGVNHQDEGCGGGLFDMFGTNDEGEEDECPAGEEEPIKVEDKPAISIRDLTIPTGWTGSTPQKKLDEVLKKQKLRRAKYTKLPMNAGFSLNVTVHKKRPNVTIDKKRPPETNHYEAKSINFVEGSSLKDYLAILALYDIDPTIQLYQIFPPTFRELWLSWMNQVREEKDQEQKVQDDAKRERIEHLMSLIAGLQINQKAANGTSEKSDGLPEDEVNINNQLNSDDAVTDNWDDESTDDGTQAKTKPTQQSPSIMGQKLQLEFAKRQSTLTYRKMKATRDNLPMLSYRSTILETVQNNPVTIICAETGAGKSTQCGQYILEQALLDGHSDEVNIICTQPRRVAATSLAERVSDEMCDKLGKMVGYQIRMEAKRSAQTKLLFCTTGVILRRLQDDPTLSGITHIIVDEVHGKNMFLCVVCGKFVIAWSTHSNNSGRILVVNEARKAAAN